MERLCCRGTANYNAQGTDKLPEVDSRYPWEWLWAAATVDSTLWQEELEGPVTLTRAQGCCTST
eukprot:276926-Amphidinium_carterae.3